MLKAGAIVFACALFIPLSHHSAEGKAGHSGDSKERTLTVRGFASSSAIADLGSVWAPHLDSVINLGQGPVASCEKF